MIVVLLVIYAVILFLYWLQKKMAGPKAVRLSRYFDTWFSVIYVVIVIGFTIYLVFDPEFTGDLKEDSGMVFALSSAIIYLVYILLLLPIHWIEKKVFANPKHQQAFASYAWILQKNANQTESWVIRRSMDSFRNASRAFSRFLLAMTMVVDYMAGYGNESFSPLWFSVPVCSLIVIRTLYLYLDGNLAEQPKDVVKTAKAESRRISNFAGAAERLRSSFPKALLHEDQSDLDEKTVSPERKLRDLEKSADLNDHILASYFRSEQSNPDAQIDPDYIQMTIDLSQKKNVLVRNPFHEDLGLYLFPPLSDSLMERHKVLILTQGNETVDSVHRWIAKVLDSRSAFHEQWRIRELEDLVPETDIGILPYSKLYDPQIMQKNRNFFSQVEYVILLRPSSVLATMQIALNVLSDLVREGDIRPVFCILDQNMDRLKDTLSHVLKVPVHSDVVITSNAPQQTLMLWDAEADYQAIERFERLSEFLGGGVELMAEAASAGVDEGVWISENRVPVDDFQDRAAKSFRPITKVMGAEESQDALRRVIQTENDPWTMKKKDRQFLIVEDELNNPFALAGHYASRASREIFLNVLSENYLLRDYFAENAEVFRKNPQAVPSLVPDFAKTPRNILLRLILQMMILPVREEEVVRELDLVDIHTAHPFQTLVDLARKYTFAKSDLFFVTEEKIPSHVGRPKTIRHYGVHPEKFDEYFARSLKNTSYLLEDEIAGRNVLDSKLFSLILQTTLPGQYVNYAGRSYRVKSISPINGVVLRRTSDLIDSRKSYLQLRKYNLPELSGDGKISSLQINGFDFNRYEADFSVDTSGYLELKHRGSFSDAKVVRLGEGPDENFRRLYRNKTILEIRFPNAGGEALFTLSMILQELMVSVLPTGYPYLSVIAKKPENAGNRYSAVVAEAQNIPEGSLVVIEDSDMDLGLLDEFENYFFHLLEIAQDYLRWSAERTAQSPDEDEKEKTDRKFEQAVLDPSQFAGLQTKKERMMDDDDQARVLIWKICDLITQIALEKMEVQDESARADAPYETGGQEVADHEPY